MENNVIQLRPPQPEPAVQSPEPEVPLPFDVDKFSEDYFHETLSMIGNLEGINDPAEFVIHAREFQAHVASWPLG